MLSSARLRVVLALLIVVVCAPYAHADTTRLAVSGTFVPQALTTCPSSLGCTLSGDIVINDNNGQIMSTDVTFNGSPAVGPFTSVYGVGNEVTVTELELSNTSVPPSANLVSLIFSTPQPGSLLGYTGGPLIEGQVFDGLGTGPSWVLISGSFTNITAAPEPSSMLLLAGGLTGLLGLRRRIVR
jgi:hypothetical protein